MTHQQKTGDVNKRKIRYSPFQKKSAIEDAYNRKMTVCL